MHQWMSLSIRWRRGRGLEPAVARKAVGIIINFLCREGPADKVGALVDGLPGARALGDEHSGASGGLLGVFNDLTEIGLGMSQVQALTSAFIAFARTRVSDTAVDEVVSGIPGLSQFV